MIATSFLYCKSLSNQFPAKPPWEAQTSNYMYSIWFLQAQNWLNNIIISIFFKRVNWSNYRVFIPNIIALKHTVCRTRPNIKHCISLSCVAFTLDWQASTWSQCFALNSTMGVSGSWLAARRSDVNGYYIIAEGVARSSRTNTFHLNTAIVINSRPKAVFAFFNERFAILRNFRLFLWEFIYLFLWEAKTIMLLLLLSAALTFSSGKWYFKMIVMAYIH